MLNNFTLSIRFLFWGNHKAKHYTSNPHTTEGMKENIRMTIFSIFQELQHVNVEIS
jgi:hypothetical protein